LPALVLAAVALTPPPVLRRQVLAGAATLGAEASWLQTVASAVPASLEDVLLPPGAVEQIEQGRIVVVKNWLPAAEVAALHADAQEAFANGHFKADGLASYGRGKGSAQGTSSKGFDASADRMVMPSFYPSKGTDGPWVDPTIGDMVARMSFKRRMAAVKASLSRQMHDRATLAADAPQTHEMSYSRYGPGAYLARHTDEHHNQLKLNAVAKPTRRSVSWLVYLNAGWDAAADGGCLRVHEREAASVAPVGARGSDLQIGWLRATARQGETPVFLDANRRGGSDGATCMLYACALDGSTRDLSAKPFAASPALYLGGGDIFVRTLLVDAPADRERFHLVDAPKSAASAFMPDYGPAGEDGGERVRDIPPEGGTLVLFDSVSLPHEVRPTVGRERFACSGWFHENIVA